jgi:hypothetical protein
VIPADLVEQLTNAPARWHGRGPTPDDDLWAGKAVVRTLGPGLPGGDPQTRPYPDTSCKSAPLSPDKIGSSNCNCKLADCVAQPLCPCVRFGCFCRSFRCRRIRLMVSGPCPFVRKECDSDIRTDPYLSLSVCVSCLTCADSGNGQSDSEFGEKHPRPVRVISP